jgi:hypothetical protein
MKETVYCPKHGSLWIIEGGYALISYSGGIAGRKFIEAIEAGEEVSIAGGDYRVKLKPANVGYSEFVSGFGVAEAPVQSFIIKRKDYV